VGVTVAPDGSLLVSDDGIKLSVESQLHGKVIEKFPPKRRERYAILSY